MYNHNYSTDNRSVALGYQCGICGRLSHAQRRFPQCGVCGIPLCTTCNRFGFCAKHFEMLKPAEQMQAQQTFLKMKRVDNVFVGVLLIGLIAIGVGFPVTVVSSSRWTVPPEFFSGVLIAFIAYVLFLIIYPTYNRIITRRGLATFQEIGQSFRPQQETLRVP
jgi:hypothetical protein